ncbi:folate family ECF transporter S component [Lachnospiraceae bacterium C1.1]|nr:folate family ECF transporter S component [Lachnospiraceae bacterium C1.1]
MSKLKNTHVITVIGMLTAVAVILGYLKIPVNSLIEIRFTNLPIAVGGALLGPVAGGLVGALSDIVQYLAKPTGPFFPGFTISSCITGIIFGLLLRKDGKSAVSLKRIIISELLVTLLVSLPLNSLWLSMLYGNAFIVVLSSRLLKEIVMFPINTLLLIAVIKPVGRFSKTLLPLSIKRS